MLFKNGYWYFKNAVNKDFCKLIEDIVKKIKPVKGTISGITNAKSQKKQLYKTRQSDVKFFSDQVVYDQIVPFVRKANDSANWNYEFDWVESAQYTIYKKNQHYDWHCDQPDEAYKSNDINFNGKTRKLSCTLLLNNSSEYEGGDFEFDFRNKKTGSNITKVTQLNNQGDLIVFPSYIWHRVKPITKGTRKSLVLWFIGPPFK